MLNTRQTRATAALLLAMVLFARHSAAQETFEIVARFPTSATRPEGPLLLAPDGSIYATAPTGGAFGRGSVFVLRPDGMGGYSQEDLYSFSGPDGIAPVYGVTFGADGRLYGTTSRGGPADAGTFFRIDGAGHLTQLATVAAGGGSPPGPLSLGSDGNLYGSSSGGGVNGAGTIFRLDASSGTLTTLHDFGPGEGSAPYSKVVQGSDGRYYGTTTKGGSSDLGTVYAIDASGSFQTIHEFSGSDGSDPGASFLAASDGALYGTTTMGGATGYGTIYRITVAGDLTTLYDFVFSPAYDPPKARRLVEAIDGNFYGTTAPDLVGGSPSTFYRINSLGNYTFISLFPPIGPMTPGVSGDGSIYVAGYGVYRLDLSGNSTALSAGSSPPQVQKPIGRLIESPAGTLYALASSDREVLLRLDLSGPPSVAHEFPLFNYLNTDLLRLDDGSFYGTTYSGPGEDGSVFKLDASFVETDLHDFSGGDGSLPYVGLTAGPSGEIWGTTRSGGANQFGTIFKIDSLGAFTSLNSFDAGQTSWDPLVYATDGNFYGLLKDDAYFVSSATAFRADSQGSVTLLHDFTPGGRFPTSLFQATDGDFYGIMATPPFDTSPGDTIFRMNSAGAVTPLYDFTSGSGRRLFRVGDGTIYGSSPPIDPPDPGYIFRMDSATEVPIVHVFDGGQDGVAYPWPDLLLASDGNLYGTAGGDFGGAIYRLRFEAPSPTLDAIEPTSGRAAGGAGAVIHGSHFRGPVVQASLGATPTPTVLLFDQSMLTTVSPPLVPGTLYDLTVTNGDATIATLPAAWFADFLDVPGDHLFHDFIEKVFRNGITAGCGGGSYCPSAAVTRAQMAVFLLKAQHGSVYTPPPCTGHFGDVDCPSAFADWIEQLAAENITAGCGDGTNYCPGDSVTRQQMAVFLLKTEHGSGYTPPPCAQAFLDVPCPSLFADWIEQLAAEGITGGCGAGNFCPANPNTRGQMAVFLTKTFSLP